MRARRYGLASLLSTVVFTLEELVVERCYDLITTAALRAMGGCKSLKVGLCDLSSPPIKWHDLPLMFVFLYD